MASAKLLWRGPTRVYFNAWNEGPLYWSVDRGAPASEIKCTCVHVAGLHGETVVDRDGKQQPRAWLWFGQASVYLYNDGIWLMHRKMDEWQARGI